MRGRCGTFVLALGISVKLKLNVFKYNVQQLEAINFHDRPFNEIVQLSLKKSKFIDEYTYKY